MRSKREPLTHSYEQIVDAEYLEDESDILVAAKRKGERAISFLNFNNEEIDSKQSIRYGSVAQTLHHQFSQSKNIRILNADTDNIIFKDGAQSSVKVFSNCYIHAFAKSQDE